MPPLQSVSLERLHLRSCGSTRHVLLRQGVVGIKVKIMLDHDPKGRIGPKTPIPDTIIIKEPKEDENMAKPIIGAEN
jgi:small subunit ribosomal protein S3e